MIYSKNLIYSLRMIEVTADQYEELTKLLAAQPEDSAN